MNPEPVQTHASVTISLKSQRCSEVREILRVLAALEAAYNSLYAWYSIVSQAEEDSREGEHYRGMPRRSLIHFAEPNQAVPEEDRLCLARIEPVQPAFVEIVGAEKPLGALRNYLLTRPIDWDREKREAEEGKRLIVENHRINIVREEVEFLRELNYPEIQIREALSRHIFAPMDRIDRLRGLAAHEEGGPAAAATHEVC